MAIIVTGAPGNVGSPLVEELLEAGADVRVAVSRRRIGAFAPERCSVVPFDFTDLTTFPDAFAGVESMFLLRPPRLSRPRRDIVPALQAARASGVRFVVFLSVQGANCNPAVPHHAIEVWLRRSGLRWAFLRAAYFMQNLTTTHAPELARGELFVPAGRARIALVDARDVASVAAAALLRPADSTNRAWTPTGPQALTFDECARVLTAEWGRPITYARPSILRYWRTLRARGVPPAMLAVTIGLYTAGRLGLAAGLTKDVRLATGQPARDFRTFARDTPPPR